MPFNPAKAKLAYQLTFEGSWPTAVAFIGTNRLAAANQLGHIYIWDLPDQPPEFKAEPKSDRKAPNIWPVRKLDGHTNEITRLVATRNGKHLVSSSLDKTVRVWPADGSVAGKEEVILDSESRKREARRQGKKEPAPAPGISVEVQKECGPFVEHKEWVYALGLSGDGMEVISGDAASQVYVWELKSRKVVSRWSGHSWNWIVAASLSPDGETALVSENRYKRDDFDVPAPGLKLWNVQTGKEKLDILKAQFPKFDATVRTYGASQLWRKFVANGLIATDWSPDAKLLAVGQGGETDTGKVHLIDAKTGKLVRDVSGHKEGVTDVLFTMDGKYVISAGRDTVVRVCQVSDGKEVAVLGSPRGGQFKDWLSAIALSTDERYLAASDIAGLVHVWES
jgi:WD40 repeat protein